MYKLFRNTHLILGLIAVPFLLMYAASAVQMAHRIRLTHTIQESQFTLLPALEPRAVAQQLMDYHGYSGELVNIESGPTAFRFDINRIGTSVNVIYERATGRTLIRESTQGFMGMLNRLHHAHGLSHSTPALNAWGWALAFISVTLLLLGATGVYMWFRLRKERIIGAILLSANLVVSLGLLFALRAAMQ